MYKKNVEGIEWSAINARDACISFISLEIKKSWAFSYFFEKKHVNILIMILLLLILIPSTFNYQSSFFFFSHFPLTQQLPPCYLQTKILQNFFFLKPFCHKTTIASLIHIRGHSRGPRFQSVISNGWGTSWGRGSEQ